MKLFIIYIDRKSSINFEFDKGGDCMKKKYIMLGIVLLLVVSALIWWSAPTTFLATVNANEVTSIHVRNGSNGNSFEIESQEDILYIVDNIQKQSFEKDGVSLFHMGTLYTLSFYNGDGKQISEFIVNGDDTIRKDPFFYRTNSGGLQTIVDYLNTLEDK